MASKSVFGSNRTSGAKVAPTNTTNNAGGKAYKLTAEEALAQLSVTCCFNDTFYSAGPDLLAAVKQAAANCSSEFIAKCAIWARDKGHMKDMPAALLAVLSLTDKDLFEQVFPRIITNGKMLRNFAQMIRSGAFGRRSFGSKPKRLIKNWINNATAETLLRASVGNSPSLADIIKMVRPRPANAERAALYAYLIGKEYNVENLPSVVSSYENWKKGNTDGTIPNVDFRQLTNLPLTTEQWTQIALNGGWTQTRMNLNTYNRHKVFNNSAVVAKLANKLSDPKQIQKAKAFPYQLMMAYLNTSDDLPFKLRDALQTAMDIATSNVKPFDTTTHVIVDVSGSMSFPISGFRKGATTKTRCIDVAALIAATILRQNPGSTVIPVDTSVHKDKLNPRDSIMTNATRLAKFGGGGTDLAEALRHLNAQKATGGLIIMVSDNESWFSGRNYNSYGNSRGSDSAIEFAAYQKRNRGAKMVCINLSPGTTTQLDSGNPDIINIGGWSDETFNVINRFVNNPSTSAWVDEINKVDLYDRTLNDSNSPDDSDESELASDTGDTGDTGDTD